MRKLGRARQQLERREKVHIPLTGPAKAISIGIFGHGINQLRMF
jgi:hypothetical protein